MALQSPPLLFCRAFESDVPALVRLLADDFLGANREALSDLPADACYLAFAAIDADPNNELIVAALGTEAVGMLQLTSDKQRPDAIRFYESLGFVATHEGFKMALPHPEVTPGSA